MSRELLARAWAAGAGPGGAPLTIDLDSTICETSELSSTARRDPPLQGASEESESDVGQAVSGGVLQNQYVANPRHACAPCQCGQ